MVVVGEANQFLEFGVMGELWLEWPPSRPGNANTYRVVNIVVYTQWQRFRFRSECRRKWSKK